MSYALPTTSDWEWVPSAREGSARAYATRARRLIIPQYSDFVWMLDHFRARPVRDNPRGSTPRCVAGDRRPPGGRRYHDARLIGRVGLGRIGLLGEEVRVLLEGRLTEYSGLPELGREVAVPVRNIDQ